MTQRGLGNYRADFNMRRDTVYHQRCRREERGPHLTYKDTSTTTLNSLDVLRQASVFLCVFTQSTATTMIITTNCQPTTCQKPLSSHDEQSTPYSTINSSTRHKKDCWRARDLYTRTGRGDEKGLCSPRR